MNAPSSIFTDCALTPATFGSVNNLSQSARPNATHNYLHWFDRLCLWACRNTYYNLFGLSPQRATLDDLDNMEVAKVEAVYEPTWYHWPGHLQRVYRRLAYDVTHRPEADNHFVPQPMPSKRQMVDANAAEMAQKLARRKNATSNTASTVTGTFDLEMLEDCDDGDAEFDDIADATAAGHMPRSLADLLRAAGGPPNRRDAVGLLGRTAPLFRPDTAGRTTTTSGWQTSNIRPDCQPVALTQPASNSPQMSDEQLARVIAAAIAATRSATH